jgi:hypothetical protein
MEAPAIGESADVMFNITHTEYTMLVEAVEQIDSALSGKTTAAASRWFSRTSQDRQERIINAAAFLAKFVREDILEI